MRFHRSPFSRYVACVVLATLTFQSTACSSWHPGELEPAARDELASKRILEVTTLGGEVVALDQRPFGAVRDMEMSDERGYRVVPPSVHNDTIFGRVEGLPFTLGLSEVASARVQHAEKRFSTGKTVGLVFGVLAGAAVLGVLVFAAACSGGGCQFGGY